MFIKNNYMNASLVFPKVLVDQSIIVFDMYNTQSKFVFKYKNDLCSCYVSKAKMIHLTIVLDSNIKFNLIHYIRFFEKQIFIFRSDRELNMTIFLNYS